MPQTRLKIQIFLNLYHRVFLVTSNYFLKFQLPKNFFSHDAKKKGQLTKQLKEVQKNNQCLRRVMEGLFLSHAGPKRG